MAAIFAVTKSLYATTGQQLLPRQQLQQQDERKSVGDK
jgi:hypothetical protein